MKHLREIKITIEPSYQNDTRWIRSFARFDDGTVFLLRNTAVADEKALHFTDDRVAYAELVIDAIAREMKNFMRHEAELEAQPTMSLLEMAQAVDAFYRKRSLERNS